MQITIQQNGGNRLSRRRFQVANGHYENAAYNDGKFFEHRIGEFGQRVPSYFVMLAMPDRNELGYADPKVADAYLEKYSGQEAIILGFASSEEADAPANEARWWEHLQERAVGLAELQGLEPMYTLIDIFENNYQATLYGS